MDASFGLKGDEQDGDLPHGGRTELVGALLEDVRHVSFGRLAHRGENRSISRWKAKSVRFPRVNLAAIFLGWQSILLGLILYVVTEAERRLIQSSWKGWRTNRVYTEFVLWISPCANGALAGALVRNFPWPAELVTTTSRVVYGVVLGLFCGAIYNRAKKILFDKEV
jgi:hypothetical protein